MTMTAAGSIIRCCLLPPNSSSIPLPLNPSPLTRENHSSRYSSRKGEPRLIMASLASAPPLDYAGSLGESHGVSFSGIGDSCVVRMAMENGSEARVMLPSGLITSYKPSMWHGGTMELLHTTVSAENNSPPLIHGGVSLHLKCVLDGGASLWCPNSWLLRGVQGSPDEFIQVQLLSHNAGSNVEVKHVITLKEDALRSEVAVSNSGDSSCHFTAAILTHLTVSTPEATYALGLGGSDYFSCPPLLSDFSLIHPSFGNTAPPSKQPGFLEAFSGWGATKTKKYEERHDRIHQEISQGEEEEEEDDYKNLQEEMSRIYTNAPRSITILDRGRRNSVQIGREGFKQLYMFSPGSSFDWYGKYAYVCLGPAALLQPVTLASQCQWRGKQHLYNPNV